MASATYDNSAKGSGTGGATARSTNSFAIAGSNRVLYVFVGTGAVTPQIPTSVKWNTTESLTQIGTTIISTDGRFTLWRLIAPTATTGTVDVAWSGSQDEQLVIAISVKDCDQATPNNTVAQAGPTTGSTAATVNATSVSGDLVIDGCFFVDTSSSSFTLAPSGGQTSRQEIEGAATVSEGLGVSTLTATGTSTTMPWTISGIPLTDGWSMFAFATNGAGPTITAQPTSQTVFEGNTATFNITATGTGTLHYQWKFNGSNVGTDTNSYARSNCVFADNGAIVTCAVTDDNGTTTSSNAYLYVLITADVFLFKG